MKNKAWIVIAIVLALVMVAAVWLYPKLSEEYQKSEMMTENYQKSETSQKTQNEQMEPAYDFAVLDSQMNRTTLSDKFGKPIVINFWASWCYPCMSELPAFNEMYEKYKDEVEFLMINLTDGQRDTVDGIKSFVSQNGYTFPVYYDIYGDASMKYGVYSIPETVFIDADGYIYNIQVGAMSQSRLEAYIKQLKGE